MVYVFNCSEQMDYKVKSLFFNQTITGIVFEKILKV